jgi:EmrB/QacA subfamily drug resistance transporter
LFSGKAISTAQGSAPAGRSRSLPRVDDGKSINWPALLAIGVATVTIANDFSAINVALPTMEGDFHTEINTIQWVVNAYALTFGVMIVTGGRLADMFGRKNAFFGGATIFAVMSAAGGLAPTETFLIVTRALMGVGAALMLPAIIGMTYGLLPEEKAGLAGGVIMGAAGLGNAIGPLVGGVFTDLLTWRWIFFLNVPVAALAILVIWRTVHLDESPDTDHTIDYRGIAAISIGLVSLLIALDQVDNWGWSDPRVIAMLALAAVLIVAFVPIERRAGRHALIPPAIIGNRSFAASCAAILCMSATFFAALLYLPQFMESQLSFSPLEAGLGMVPALATFALVSFVAGPLYGRLGPKLLTVIGAACMTAASILFSLVGGDSGYGALVPGMIVLGIGIGTFYATATTAGVTSVDESQASLAGGIVYMFQIAGGSIGLGLTTTVFSSADPPFIDGFQAAFRLDGAIALVGLAISVLFVGGTLLSRRTAAVT